MENEQIDFVITWVNGNDPKWREEKNKYSIEKNDDNIRFREWDNLQYWFRAVEKFTPWVNKIHFVTYGHIPKWLNTNNPKINIVKHQDFIPAEYLPTFNSRAIEMNLHRIKGIKEKFVYFNDDMFITRDMKKSDFFKEGLPKDILIMQPIIYKGEESTFSHMLLNNTRVINNNFNKNESFKKNIGKWINLKYGVAVIKTISTLYTNNFIGFSIPHLPASYLKSTFDELWEKEYDLLNKTSAHKFRDMTDVNPFLFSYWQMAKGLFSPRSKKVGKYLKITNENSQLKEIIKKQKCKMICINDTDKTIDFEKAKNDIIEAFDYILHEKSSFEI